MLTTLINGLDLGPRKQKDIRPKLSTNAMKENGKVYELCASLFDHDGTVNLSQDGIGFRFELGEAYIEYGGFEFAGRTLDKPRNKGIVDNSQLIYDVVDGISVNATLNDNMVKVDYIISDFQTAARLRKMRIPYTASGFILEQIGDHSIKIKLLNSDEGYMITNLVAKDALGNHTQVRATFDESYIYLHTDIAWLRQAKYPVVIDPTTTGLTTTVNSGSDMTEQPWAKFSDGTLVLAYTNATSSTYFATSRDNGTTWTQAKNASNVSIAISLIRASIRIVDDVVYVVGTEGYGGVVKVYRYTVDPNDKTIWTVSVPSSTTISLSSSNYCPVFMEPYKEADGLVRLPVGWIYSVSPDIYANFVVVKDNANGTFTVVSPSSSRGVTTRTWLNSGARNGWVMDGQKNIHTINGHNTNGLTYSRIPNTGIDSWGVFSTSETLKSSASDTYGAVGIRLKNGKYSGKVFFKQSNNYIIKNTDGTTVENSIDDNSMFGSGLENDGMCEDEFGNIWFASKKYGNDLYYTFYLYDGVNGFFRYPIAPENLNESGMTQYNVKLFSDGNGKVRWGYINKNGSVTTSYDLAHGSRVTTAFQQKLAMNMGNGPRMRYFSNGDAVILYQNPSSTSLADKFALIVTKDFGKTWSSPSYLPSVPAMPTANIYILMELDEDGNIHIVLDNNPSDSGTGKIYYWRGRYDATRTTLTWLISGNNVYNSPLNYQTNLSYDSTNADMIIAHKEGSGYYCHVLFWEEQYPSQSSHTQYLRHLRIYSTTTSTPTVTTITVTTFSDLSGNTVMLNPSFDPANKKMYIPYMYGSPTSYMVSTGTYVAGSPGSWGWSTTTAATYNADTDNNGLRATIFTKTTGKRVKNTNYLIYHNGSEYGAGYTQTQYASQQIQGGLAMVEGDNIVHFFGSVALNSTTIEGTVYNKFDNVYASLNLTTLTWSATKKSGDQSPNNSVNWAASGKRWPTGITGKLPFMINKVGPSGVHWGIFQVSSNAVPGAPTHSNITNSGYTINDKPKLFFGVSDPDSGNTITNIQIQVASALDFASGIFWDIQYGADSGYGVTQSAAGFSGLPASSGAVVTWQAPGGWTGLTAGTWYIRARTKDNIGDWSTWSSTQSFVVSTGPWNDTLTPNLYGFKAVWMNDLANIINAARQFRGLATVAFLDGTITAQTTDVKSAHITERRNSLVDVLTIVGVIPAWTDVTPTDRNTQHIIELRSYSKQT